MPEFKVRVSRKIFTAADSGFSVFKVSILGSRESVTVVGRLPEVKVGDFLLLEGEEVDHPKFGHQIRVDQFQFFLPQDEEGIGQFLSSGRIKGIGPKTAQKIINRFGSRTLQVLEEDPERLKEIRGIRIGIIEEVRKSFSQEKPLRDVLVRLAPAGISAELALRIYQEFETDALTVLSRNPFQLVGRVRGVGFRIADRIAQLNGIERHDPRRIGAAIMFLLEQAEFQQGDLYLPHHVLVHRAVRFLEVEAEIIESELAKLVESKSLLRLEFEEAIIVKPSNLIVEKESARDVFRLVGRFQEVVDRVGTNFPDLELELNPEQKAAVVRSVSQPLTIITGGPGTGKTTLIRAIVEVLQHQNKRVALAAPTGRAAKRIEECCFYSASTIHRLLKIDPERREFQHNRQNPLKIDCLVVDEFSMVDAFLFQALLQALPANAQLVVIGDQDQLPPVGPGNVLKELIGCGFLDTVALKWNFRQNQDSLLLENAYRLNRGQELRIQPYSDDLDFVLLTPENDSQVLTTIARIINFYRADYPWNSANLQIISPMYRGPAGIDRINDMVQEQFNSESVLIEKESLKFKKRDKVMQLKNNYGKDVFNGDKGVIEAYAEDRRVLMVNFDGRLVEYGPDELDELTLAYAVSVHKAQGSEYDIVVLCLLSGHAPMLYRELFYTAITRAKKRLILLSDPKTVFLAARRHSPTPRKTLLGRFLREYFGQNRSSAIPGPAE